jgi:hypothetical protein
MITGWIVSSFIDFGGFIVFLWCRGWNPHPPTYTHSTLFCALLLSHIPSL